MCNILILDDEPVLRLGLREVLKRVPGAKIDGEAGNGPALLKKLAQSQAAKQPIGLVVMEVLLLDGGSTLDKLQEIKLRFRSTPVLVHTNRSEQEYGLHALESGADGFIRKTAPVEELLRAIERIISGGKYLSRALQLVLIGHAQPELEGDPLETLSLRQHNVMLRLDRHGESNQRIGQKLALSRQAVTTYRGRILLKMKLETNAQIARELEKRHLL